ncbi:ParB/RepB/Spo0J family partition protein [Paenibacillus cellulositrophicus]|uniref:ParB N-terminal domain-containing protein n=1 Tax=Paenibacillus lacisoli TaxID=3064525 RepID=A0ABT9CLP8_9BACL|nr:ParB N-terminal domain-containing protein [Paenibacillus sp. JX-17]MDO7908533.1 ParB N-terminal domain-containing protein [Paenibacillus sp. JX-17]
MEAYLAWVAIDLVIPNPMNPRRDHSIESEQMQEILRSKGWAEAITCYRKGQYYIILSGHRRWHAAKKMNEKEVPVYIVQAPENNAEELDRLGSIQGGQVDWTPYEWAKYTYDIWKNSGKASYSQLANKLGISQSLVGSRIRVYKFYPRIEIEDKLSNGMYSLSMLDYILKWIKRVEKHHFELYQSMGEELIRKQMLKKYENRCFNSKIAIDNIFVTSACSKDILEFLTDINKKLQDCQFELELLKVDNEVDVTQNKLNVKMIIDEIRLIECRTKNEAGNLKEELNKLLKEIELKENQLFDMVEN